MNTSKWIGLIIIIITIFVVIYITQCQNVRTEPITHNVEVVQDEYGVWRIEDNNGYDRGSIVLNRGDIIDWKSVESDVQFAFPVDADEYFEFADSLLDESRMEVIERFGSRDVDLEEIFSEKRSQYVERGGLLQLRVKEDAPTDTLEYHVYVAMFDTVVVGNSPPNLIIR